MRGWDDLYYGLNFHRRIAEHFIFRAGQRVLEKLLFHSKISECHVTNRIEVAILMEDFNLSPTV